MSEQEYIDKLFKERLHSREFEVDEQAWKAAEKLLDQHDRKFRGGWKNSLYALMLLLVISSTVYVSMQPWRGEEMAGESVLARHEEQTAEKPGNSPTAHLAEPAGIQEEAEKDREAPVATGELKGSEESSHYSAPSPALAAQRPAFAGRNRTVEPTVATVENKVPENSGNVSAKTGESISTPSTAKAAETTPSARSRGNLQELAPARGMQSASFPQNGAQPNLPRPPKRVGQMTSSDLTRQSSSTYAMNNSLWVLERMEALKPSLVVEYEKDILKGKVELQQKQHTSRKLLTGWGVIAGGGYGIGNGGSQGDNSPGRATIVFGGVRYARYLNSGFSLHGNLLYKQISNLDVEVIIESQSFDFGFNNRSITIRSRKLTYIELPVYLNYYAAGRYNFYAGAQYAKLAAVLSEEVTVSENNFENTLQRSKREYGYRGHIESYQMSVLAGAEYLLNERLSIGLRYNHGLSDIANSRYVKNNNFKINEIKITLNINVGN